MSLCESVRVWQVFGHAMHYYDPQVTRQASGSFRWYDWVSVFWLTIMTWVIGQLAFTSPFMSMLAEYDPEASASLNALMTDNVTVAAAAQMGFGGLLFMIGAIMAAIALGVHYLGSRGKPSLVTGMIGAFMTFMGGGLFVYGSRGMGEANNVILSVIGLSPVAYFLMLLTFPAALVGLYLGWKAIHKSSLTALHTAWSQFRWRRVFESFIIMWAVLGGYAFLVSRFSGNPPELIFDASRFLPFAIVSILFLPIQSATEEIVVRGYMNKGLVHFMGNKWIAFTVTSGLFMALHLANPEAQAGAAAGNLPIVMSGYFFFGFAACLMVLIDDGLESAIGVHAGNNTFAAIFVNYENSVLPTPSVWQVQADPTKDAIATILILSIVLVVLYLTRKTKSEISPTVI